MSGRLVIVPYLPEHLKNYADAAVEISMRTYLKTVDLEALAINGPSYTAMLDGKPICSSGFVENYGPGSIRATVWAILLSLEIRWFLPIHRACLKAIADSPYRRIEAQCRYNDGKARRWAELLGFHVETEYKPLWMPDASAAVEYVLLR